MEDEDEQITRTYILRFIVKPGIAPDDLHKYSQSLNEKVSALGGKIEASICSEGVRALAYPIAREQRGYFCESVFQANQDQLKGFSAGLKQDSNILRYVIEKRARPGKTFLRPSEARKAEWKKKMEEASAKTSKAQNQPILEQEKRGKISMEEIDKKLDEIIKNI